MATDLMFAPADDAGIRQEAAITVDDARALRVLDADTYARAGAIVTGLATLKKRIVDFFAADIDRAHKLHKSLTAKRADAVAPLEAEIDRLGREMARFVDEQERARREAAQRVARELAEEQRRLALEEAAALEAQGLAAQAEAVVAEAIAAPAPVVVLAPAVPKADGVSYRSTWRFEVVDAAAVPREYLSIDEQKIGGVVRALKAQTNIPGVRVYEERSAVIKG